MKSYLRITWDNVRNFPETFFRKSGPSKIITMQLALWNVNRQAREHC